MTTSLADIVQMTEDLKHINRRFDQLLEENRRLREENAGLRAQLYHERVLATLVPQILSGVGTGSPQQPQQQTKGTAA